MEIPENMDKELTVPKWVLKIPQILQMPQNFCPSKSVFEIYKPQVVMAHMRYLKTTRFALLKAAYSCNNITKT